MSGQCFQCASGFSIFRKEHGCKNCGFAFCSKCLKNKLPIPKLNNESHSVCDKCFNILTGKVKPKPLSYSPPEALKKLAATNERPSSPNSGRMAGGGSKTNMYKNEYGWSKGLEGPDLEIAKRLERLTEDIKKDKPAIPDQNAIEERLARLRGVEPTASSQPADQKTYMAPNKKGEYEQTLDLLDEIFDEVQIETQQPKPEDEISARLHNSKHDITKPKDSSDLANNLNRKGSHQNMFLRNIKLADGIDVNSENADENEQRRLEEFNKYIQQAAMELDMDAQKAIEDLNKDQQIMDRLKRLKEQGSDNKNEKSAESRQENDDDYCSEDDEDNEEVATRRLIKKLLEENKLDEDLANSGINLAASTGSGSRPTSARKKLNISDSNADEEEFPWCCICNEDAVLRCRDCDNDLYCKRCFREGHSRYEIRDHRSEPYTKKGGAT
ncbi:abscission/NoCut checkpoint regulator-like [Tubulanus polymorphus]|uniref:abscission/NoCut checkpoint regulator-like n=1 Tax=Tubulanus polymorphus TaxID=672921 RepID=UPI003DA3AEB0